MNGAGNAFVLIDNRDAPRLALAEDAVRSLHAVFPFDQLLALEAEADATARLRVWNADGGEVGACGNGARAAGWLLFEGGMSGGVTLSSLGGRLQARKRPDGLVEVDLGAPRLGWADIPLALEMDTQRLPYAVEGPAGVLEGPGAVSMGNPHCVFFVTAATRALACAVGPRVERDPLFPERVNVGFADVRGRDAIRLTVWERGAGLTQACGTGACATLVAAHRQGRTGREALITADGGDLPVRWDAADGHVHLSGPVELDGELDPEAIRERLRTPA